MFASIARRAPPITVGPPSTLLTFLAGEFAPRIAGVWPQPHTAFLTAPADRRHLVCLALARSGDAGLHPDGEALLSLALRTAIDSLFRGEAPEGLSRALGRLGDRAWSAADYRLLLRMLRAPGPAKSLRHAEVIDAETVRAFAALPEALITARIGAEFALTQPQARLLTEVHGVLRRRHSEAEVAETVRRWAGARDAERLFEQVADALIAEPPPPPFPGTAKLRALSSKAALRDAATRYRNCLRHHLALAADGDAAYYEWTGTPGMVVQIQRDQHYGWRLNEAKLAGNAAPPEALRRALEAELVSWGVETRRSQWRIDHALSQAHQPGFVFDTSEPDYDVYD